MRFRKQRVVLLFLALIAVCQGGWCAQPSMAPDFALSDLSGKTVRLSDFRGKAVLLEFWATWCDCCANLIPYYEKFQRQRSGTLTIMGINEGDRANAVSAFAKENGVTYQLLLDSNRKALDAYEIRGLPTAVLIDDEGKIRGRWISFNEDIASEIEKAVSALPRR